MRRPIFRGVRRPGLGDYGQGDPNTTPAGGYNERHIFNPLTGEPIPQTPRRMAQYPFLGTATPTRVLPANPMRCYLIVQNLSAATNLYLGFGAGADATNGVLILPNGGNFLADYRVPTDDLYLYFAAGAAERAVIAEGVFVVE